jgi:hypothetical protein
MLQRNMVKCNCHRLKYLVLYYKRVIALIVMPFHISNTIAGHWLYGSDFCDIWLTSECLQGMTCSSILLEYHQQFQYQLFICSHIPSSVAFTNGVPCPQEATNCSSIICNSEKHITLHQLKRQFK